MRSAARAGIISRARRKNAWAWTRIANHRSPKQNCNFHGILGETWACRVTILDGIGPESGHFPFTFFHSVSIRFPVKNIGLLKRATREVRAGLLGCIGIVCKPRGYGARISLALGLLLLGATASRAAVIITNATGGTNISADTAQNAAVPSFTTLGNIVILEGATGDFATGSSVTLMLTAPTGWRFNAGIGAASATKVSGTGSPEVN